MKCIKCEHELQPGAKFCNRCGTKQPDLLRCSKCGKSDIHHEAVYCPECGNRVSTTNLTAEEKTSESLRKVLDKSDAEIKSLRQDKYALLHDITQLKERKESFAKLVEENKQEIATKDREISERNEYIDDLQKVFKAKEDKLNDELSYVKNSLSHWTHRGNELDKREADLKARSKKLEDDYKSRSQKLEREYSQRNEYLGKAEAKVKDRANRCALTESENSKLRHNVSVMRNGGKERWWITTFRVLCLTFAVWNIGAFLYADIMGYLEKSFPREEDWWAYMGVIFCFSLLVGFVGLAKPRLGGSKFIRFCASLTPMTLWNVYPFFSPGGKDELLALWITFIVVLFGVCGAIFCATTYIRNGVYFEDDLE